VERVSPTKARVSHSTVQRIPDDRVADRGEVDANLVAEGAAGFELQERELFTPQEYPISRRRSASIASFRLCFMDAADFAGVRR
jgi:hypothetical protein